MNFSIQFYLEVKAKQVLLRSFQNLLSRINAAFRNFWTIFEKTHHLVAKRLGLLAFCPFYVLYVFRKSRPSQSNSFTFSLIDRRKVAWIPIFSFDCPSYSALLKTRLILLDFKRKKITSFSFGLDLPTHQEFIYLV